MARICLISQNAFGAFVKSGSGHIGGVERQTAALAQWLERTGHDVSVVTWAEDDTSEELVWQGIRIIPFCAKRSGIAGLRFFYPRWWKLIRALKKADADVYVHNAAEAVTGQIAIWTRIRRRKFVLSVASEPVCKRNLPTISTFRERVLYSVGLRIADKIIVQTRTQQRLLREQWGLDSEEIPMPCSPPSTAKRDRQCGSTGAILWVGRIVPLKRLELFLDLAEAISDYVFVIVGTNPEGSAYARSLLERAKTLRNVQLKINVEFDEMWDIYREASFLVCTSVYEGFPNTFLEAFYFGIPVVTTFDPGDVVERKKLGVYCKHPRDLEIAIKRLKSDSVSYEGIGQKARSYFDERHANPAAIRKVEEAILSSIRQRVA